MSGSYFMRVSNATGGAVGVFANNTTTFLTEPNFNFTVSSVTPTGPVASSASGSSVPAKPKITAISVQTIVVTTPTWSTPNPAVTGFTVEVGHLQKDGYFQAYYSNI